MLKKLFGFDPSRNDHLRTDECDMRQIQEDYSCDVYSCRIVHTEIHFHLEIEHLAI